MIYLSADSQVKLRRGEIIAFRSPTERSKGYIKRLIAVSGDTVEIRNSEVWVNDRRGMEPYIEPRLNLSRRSVPAMNVPDRAYVLGDNRDNSVDSRIFGVIPAELVYAKVLIP
jgi:signal peptidase I